ncbi:MAG: hypothetical protein ABSE18_03420 [Minisyncoccia bacterium]|jgi:lipoprotein NlpI
MLVVDESERKLEKTVPLVLHPIVDEENGSPALIVVVREYILMKHRTEVVLDLTEHSSLGTPELGELADILAETGFVGAKLKLVLGKKVRESFQLHRLVAVFDVYDNVAMAVGSFADN